MKKLSAKKLHKRKGISLLEAVIAIVIIVAIGASTITIIRLFNTGSARTFNMSNAITTVNNAKELFIYAQSTEEFEELLPVISDTEFAKNGKVFAFEENGYSGYVMATYGQGKDYFSALVRDSKNNIIWEIEEFTK